MVWAFLVKGMPKGRNSVGPHNRNRTLLFHLRRKCGILIFFYNNQTRRKRLCMPNSWKGVFLGLLFLIPLPLRLCAEEIIWYQMEFPPVYIQNGPYKNLGYQNIVDDLIKAALERHGHKVVYKTANMVRILHDMKNGLHAGSGGLLKSPDLDNFMVFSEPHTIALSGMLIIRKADKDLFRPFIDSSGAISLSDLMQSNTMLIGVCKDRTYSSAIDVILTTYASSGNTYTRGGRDMGKGLFSMLLSQRIDCTLLFPWEAFYIAEQMGREKEMASIPIKEMAPYVLVYAVFPKNQWGQHMVDLINPAIREFRNTKAYHKFKERWLDEESIQQYNRYVRDYYGGVNDDPAPHVE